MGVLRVEAEFFCVGELEVVVSVRVGERFHVSGRSPCCGSVFFPYSGVPFHSGVVETDEDSYDDSGDATDEIIFVQAEKQGVGEPVHDSSVRKVDIVGGEPRGTYGVADEVESPACNKAEEDAWK